MKQFMMRIVLILAIFVGYEYQVADENAAYAQGDGLRPVNLAIEPIEEELVAGQQVVVVSELLDRALRPISNAPLSLFLDGEPLQSKQTNKKGQAKFLIRLKAGAHRLKVGYLGSQVYQSAEEAIRLQIKPALLAIEVVPAIEGVTFSLKKLPEAESGSSSKQKRDTSQNSSQEGSALTPEEKAALQTAPEWQATSDANGHLRFELEEGGPYYLAIIEQEEQETLDDMKIKFKRWSDLNFEAQRKITLPRADVLQAGFETSHLVTPSFLAPDGEPISTARIESFLFKSNYDGLHTLHTNDPVWMQSTHILRRRAGLEEVHIFYSVNQVIMDGSSVVNRGEQCFYVSPNRTPADLAKLERIPPRCKNTTEWEIDLLLYSANLSAVDGIFEFPVGKGVFFHYPDGRVEEVPFNKDGTIQLKNLARGIYKVQVMGALGLATLRPIVISRNQELPLKVLTALDIGLVAALGLLLAISLLYSGRPHLFKKTLPALRNHRQA